jgi:hypothetical protein
MNYALETIILYLWWQHRRIMYDKKINNDTNNIYDDHASR